MEEWLTISCLLCVFGFIREIRPSESYITEFMFGEWHDFTEEQVYRQIYPLGIYSYLGQLVIVFLITDFLRYKPLIITLGAAGVIVWSLFIWTSSLAAMQTLEFFYGTYLAADVAYYTYIYAKVDKKYYPRVTSHTRAAIFAGKVVAGTTSQLLISFEVMNFMELNYITLGTQIFAMFWAFGLPKVDKSLYFHRKEKRHTSSISGISNRISGISQSSITSGNNEDQAQSVKQQPKAFHLLWQHFRNAYTNIRVIQWSLWYSLGFCGYLQVIFFMQVLWKSIKPPDAVPLNGGVEAVYTTFAALSALAAGYLHAGRLTTRSSLLCLAILSVLQGGALLLCCLTQEIIVSYVGFALFGTLYAFAITMVSSEIARHLEEDSFGLVFGFNTFVALILQTILTISIVSDAGLALSIIGQYTVLGFYFIIVGVIYLIFVVIEYVFIKEAHAENSIVAIDQ